MKLVTAEEMRRLEQAADAGGLSYEAMMERAGHAVALAIHQRMEGRPSRAVVLVGPGNNGGDGLVLARYLREWGHQVSVTIWKRELPEDPNLERAAALGIPIRRSEADPGYAQLGEELALCDVLVDALLGTGATGPLRGGLPELLRFVEERLAARRERLRAEGARLQPLGALLPEPAPWRPLVVAVDLPSGLNSDTGEADALTPRADLTVTFAYPKRGHMLFPGAARVGQLLVADIGIDPALAEDIPLEVATAAEVARLLPERPPDAHKGTFGKALIVAGSVNYVGAPCLAAEGAYRVGAGLVTLAVPGPIHPVVAAKVTEATYLVLPHDLGVLAPAGVSLLAERVEEYDALLLGPGLGREEATGEFVADLVAGRVAQAHRPIGFGVTREAAGKLFRLPPLVLDADALNVLAERPNWWEHVPSGSVLTPHPGEMARLLGCEVQAVNADRLGVAREAAARWGCVVALKGAYTVVASPDGRATVIPFANPALATAGTGDVLAGAIVGLMAQGLGPYDAAVCGAYLHAAAGELVSARLGAAGMLASDLLPALPRVMRRLRRAA